MTTGANAIQGADNASAKLFDNLTITPSDFLNNFGAGMFAGFGSSSATASSGLSTGDWGKHTSNININSGASLSLKQGVLWGGVALLGFYLLKKIRKGGK